MASERMRGESIETQRERYAARIRAGEGMQGPKPLYVVKKENAHYLELPNIVDSPDWIEGNWLAKYDPFTGDVITFRWVRPKLAENEKGKMSLRESDDYQVFGVTKKRGSVDLDSLPKSWDVVTLIPQRVTGGLEAAMRQQDEIKGDYSLAGVEQDRVENTLATIQSITEEFLEVPVDSRKLAQISALTEEALAEEGFIGVRDLNNKIAESLLRASTKDRLGRVNPARSRLILRSAYLDTVRREMVSRLSESKADRVFTILLIERGVTRTLLRESLDYLEELMGEEVLFDENTSDGQITAFRQDIKVAVKESLGKVRAAPYLLPARLSGVMLTSKYSQKRWERDTFKEVLSQGGVESEVDKPSVEDYVMRREPQKALARLTETMVVIDSVLRDSDYATYTVFSKQ